MIKILQPTISDNAVDHRGAIFSYVPADAIKEFCYITTRRGVERGHHYHKEFDEYIMFIEGEGIYTEVTNEEELVTPVSAGDCIYIPLGVPHTFYPTADCKMIGLLTKRWNDCEEPITKCEY